MDQDESLSHVLRLLGLLQGVEVACVDRLPSMFRIVLAIRSPSSLARLAHVCLASNVPLGVEVDWSQSWEGREDDPECVRYDLQIPREKPPYEPPSTLEVVGFHLVQHLWAIGRLDRSDVEHLMHSWNCELE